MTEKNDSADGEFAVVSTTYRQSGHPKDCPVCTSWLGRAFRWLTR